VYSVELSQLSQKFLEKLDNHLRARIEDRLKKLCENPIPTDAKFIYRRKGDKVFRCRIGDYRALYKIKDREKIVLVAKIDKRPRVYQQQ
jgi:mRNA interferase RelE/StbE